MRVRRWRSVALTHPLKRSFVFVCDSMCVYMSEWGNRKSVCPHCQTSCNEPSLWPDMPLLGASSLTSRRNMFCVCVCVCVCMFLCVCVWRKSETDRMYLCTCMVCLKQSWKKCLSHCMFFKLCLKSSYTYYMILDCMYVIIPPLHTGLTVTILRSSGNIKVFQNKLKAKK